MKIKYLIALFLFTGATAPAEEWTHLLNKDLSGFEVWIGVPHPSVEGLPEGTPQHAKFREGTPLGLNNDVKQVFSMIEEAGVPVLRVSGEIYGGLSTIESYANYHLSVQVRWGEQKWEPRLNALRDSGILYHCQGAHGAFWKVWKSSLECQVQETDLGDFYPLAGTWAEVRSTAIEGQKRRVYDPESEEYGRGVVLASQEVDAPHGEWNRIEIYTIGATAVHVVNGQIVMVLENAHKGPKPLTSGQIQIQSEGAECYYKDLKITAIDAYPESILQQVRFKDAAHSSK